MILIIFSVSSAYIVPGSNLNKTQLIHGNSSGFIENKGQIIDQNNSPNPAVKYILKTPGLNVQLRNGGFSYDVYNITRITVSPSDLHSSPGTRPGIDSLRSIYHFHRIDFDLKGANQNCEVIASGPSDEYYNYYTTGTPGDGATNVRSFSKITYKDIYRGIDLEFLLDEQKGFKYNFIVHPDGKLASIRIKVSGPEVELLNSGSLEMRTSQGDIEEGIPNSYRINSSDETKVRARFKEVGDGVYGILVDQTIEQDATIVIDPVPVRVWGTYYGGGQWDWAYDSKVDNNHQVFICGQTSSTNNIATSGAFQTTYAGGYHDVFLSKFLANGQLPWGTYFGGSADDNGSSLSVDNAGMIFLAGNTSSNTNISTPGVFQSTLLGYGDTFLAKFNGSGQRI